jgi:hypothetical protein
MAGTASGADTAFHGRFYWGAEVQSFHPCGSKKAYWVDGEEKTLQSLRDRTEKLRERRSKPYQPIYIEAVGKIDTQSEREGFAKDYDGLFNLRKVMRVSNVVPKECAK